MHRKIVSILLLAGLWLGISALPAQAVTYELDRNHSTVSFRIRHLFAYVRGSFDRFQGQFDYEPGKPEAWKVSAAMEAASINTAVEKRDNHLRSPDFFDTEKYPTLTFTSTGVTDATAQNAKLKGLLNIHGVEKPVVLDLQIHGAGKDMAGKMRSGFTATATINRKDFGLTWNKVLEAGQLMVGEEVEITIEAEGMAKE